MGWANSSLIKFMAIWQKLLVAPLGGQNFQVYKFQIGRLTGNDSSAQASSSQRT